ncbi:geranylgeranyl pyrophosphate synthase, chloroplastic-like isoform X2 [Tripterygium wilfordii]|nr:geranylgeranyl pyrophosphate synthase, chloroplastic-like isoform X2 [Tripterygium wilfordii]XP_038681567.1 geranylgeranyl pyrophosphate synthase, chloroplastic-like isoform X2 [Tripterygium wilfordii]
MQSNGLSEFSLEEYMNSKLKRVNTGLDEPVPLETPKKKGKAMRYSLLGGAKRLRTIICIASCELVGGDEALAMPIACTMEFINICSSGGEEVANLASTALFYLPFEHIDVPLNRVVRAIVELCSAIWSDCLMAGQFGDLDCEGKEINLEKLEHIHLNKTARLLEASVVCGAIIGGGSESDVERLRKYGSRIGLLFQMVDDILEVTKSTKELGKTVGKDLTSNKTTFPKLMGIEKARNFAQKLVDQAVEELAHFDAARAVPLYHLAHFIADRQN